MSERKEMRRILAEARSLLRVMEKCEDSDIVQAQRWNGYPTFISRYSKLATKYIELSGEADVAVYDASKLPSPYDVIWLSAKSYFDTAKIDLESLIGRLEESEEPPKLVLGFNELLDEDVVLAASRHYESGDYRNAVLDAIIAVFDRMRAMTGLDLDGDDLINQCFSPKNPRLILSDLGSDSGLNDQRGFMDIYKGLYRGVRNPKAHSLVHDLDQRKAGQYLVFISLLMRRLNECTVVDRD